MDSELVATIEKIGPVVVSFGGLVIAGLSLIFTFMKSERERRAAYQIPLFLKQLEAYREVLDALEEYQSIYMLALTPELYPNWEDELRAARSKFYDVFNRWSLVLPSGFHRAVINYTLKEFDLAMFKRSPEEKYEALQHDLLEVIGLARKGIGVDSLSAEIAKQLGRIKEPRDRSRHLAN